MSNRLIGGVVGGVVGGLVFGTMMQMMGMIGMVAGLVGASGAGVGWLVHLLIAAIIGFGYGVVTLRAPTNLVPNLGLGAAYGLAWWILGPLLIMPAAMGGALFQLNQTTMLSLMGHIVYGVITGAVAAVVWQRSARTTQSSPSRA